MKVQEARLRWYGQVLRADMEGVERRMMDMEVLGRGGRGTLKTRWKDCIAADVREKQVDIGMVRNMNAWRQLIKNSDTIIINRLLTLLTYPLLIFQQLCPFNRDKISSFLIQVLKFHDFYLDNTIYKMA